MTDVYLVESGWHTMTIVKRVYILHFAKKQRQSELWENLKPQTQNLV